VLVCTLLCVTPSALSAQDSAANAPAVAHVAQDSVVAGSVIDAITRMPVEAAQVQVMKGTAEALTDVLGRFAIGHLPPDRITLLVRRVGYQPLTDTVRVGDHRLRLYLQPAAVPMDVVVVTGTPAGSESRAIGNAVTSTKVSDVLEHAPVADVQDVLARRVPGITIMPTNGNVGSGAMIRIRGVTSMFLPNDPLVYVDGARVDNDPRAGPYIRGGPDVSRLGDFTPQEIASIDVIKGPAAATLYGTEASRGVVQIFTHRGVEGPPRWTFTMRQGANWFEDPEERLNWVYAKDPSTGGLDSVNLYQQEADAGRPIFHTGQPQSYALSVSGGTPTVRYYVSGEAGRDVGVVTYDWRNRTSGRANISVYPSNKLDIQANLGYVRNDMRLGQMTATGTEIGYDIMTQMAWGTPLTVNTPLRGFLRATPEAITAIEATDQIDRFIGSVQVNHRPSSWFSQRLTVGSDVGNESNSVLFPSDPTLPFGTLSQGDLTVQGDRVALSSFDYVANGTAALGTELKATTSVGAQFYHKRTDGSQEYGHGFPAGVTVVSGAAVTTSLQNTIEAKSGGVFAQELLGWKNRRFLTGALRADKNSAFGDSVGLVTYPKLSATWVISEEPFWRAGVINALKLRGAWGMAGRQPDVFAAERTYQPVSGPGGTPALTPQNVGNPDLRPERGQELEVGFDAGLWRDRVAATFTYYRQDIKDAIVPQTVPPSSGFPGTKLINLGEVLNSGFEASIDARLVSKRSGAWDLGASFSTNNNHIVTLGIPSVDLAAVNSSINQEANQYLVQGYPVAGYFVPVIVSASLDATGKTVNIMCSGGPDNGNQPVPCANAPRLYVGRATPSWEGNVRTTITLRRNLMLYGLVDFRGGNLIFSGTAVGAHRQQRNTRAINTTADTLLLAADALNAQGVPGGGALEGLAKGGFAKLREVSLTYTFPVSWANRMRAASVALTVAARNLAILWQEQKDVFGFKIVDPEVRTGVDLGAEELNQLPPYTQVMAMLQLNF